MTDVGYEEIIESSYPYTSGQYWTEDGRLVIEKLFDLLSHGSGINGTWSILQDPEDENRFECDNTYSAMNNAGGYCHDFDFTATIVKDDNALTVEEIEWPIDPEKYECCGGGLNDYLVDTINENIREYK